MSDGITDCRSEEEKKAAEMVEKRCRNCIYSKCNLSSFCVICSDKSKFAPSRAAIDAKVEELRNQRKSWESEGDESKKKSEREEMIELLKNLVEWNRRNGGYRLRKIEKGEIVMIDDICEEAEAIITKVEGK